MKRWNWNVFALSFVLSTIVAVAGALAQPARPSLTFTGRVAHVTPVENQLGLPVSVLTVRVSRELFPLTCAGVEAPRCARQKVGSVVSVDAEMFSDLRDGRLDLSLVLTGLRQRGR